jgi:hypothetical protein
MGRFAQGLYVAGQALIVPGNFSIRNAGILEALGQRFMKAGELQAGQMVGFVFEQTIGRQQA